MDAFINMRDLVVGDNDWYNVTPSVRRAIEGFALILRDHEARLLNGGDSRSPMATARSPSEEFGSSTLEVAQLKDRIARLEEELVVAKRRVAEVTDVAWMPIHTLESKLKTGDPNVVPRTPEYQTAFFQKLREEYNYAGSAPVR